MRTTIDIPDEKYKNLKRLAVERDSTMRELLLEALNLLESHPLEKRGPERLDLPLIRSDRKDKIDLTNEQIYDLIGFP
jgi:hypothetical protein